MSLGPKIAVTGIGLRVSGASDLDAFWSCLVEGRDPFVPLPNARFDPEIFASELPERKARSVLGALVEDFGLDWRSLRLPPAQVERLHHVERLSLAVMGDALKDAGFQPRKAPKDKTGIWFAAGTIGSDPWLDPIARIRRAELVTPLRESLEALLPKQSASLGAVIERVSELAAPPLEPDVLMISACIIAGRASQIYDLRGGHLAIDAGMCSSMAAISQAAHALAIGDVDVAVVCAAAPLVTPSFVLSYVHAGYLAHGRPCPFAATAAGTLLGDGAIATVLERADDVGRRRAYAVVEGVGSAAAPDRPNGEALAHCVGEAAREALRQAGVEPARIGRIESRACGVSRADRAEAEGLAAAYRRTSDEPISLTSSIPSFGFLQAASGLLAFVKAALCLHRRCWPGQANVGETFEPAAGLRVSSQSFEWNDCRRVAVSDAGPDSVAYHVILSDPRDTKDHARPARRTVQCEPIAIVGLGVVAPGARNTDEFWHNALERIETWGDLPCSRWNVDQLIGSSVELARAFRTRLASTVDLSELKAEIRGEISRVADSDPAILLALSAVEQALHDASYASGGWPTNRVRLVCGQISQRVGEIAAEKRIQHALLVALACDAMREAGVGEAEIGDIAADARARFDVDNRRFSADTLAAFTGTTTVRAAAARFGLTTELLSLDAACASSLAAVKIACDALRSGGADVALACGVSFHLVPEYYIGLGLLDALSTRAGRPFHRDADGFVPAEAAGAVVLKRLSDARQAKDRIYAIIAGHGIASDGHGLSIYAPNPLGQQRAMKRALDAAGWSASSVDLLEAHGPAAPLGDRAEMTSTAAIYAERPCQPPLSVASAKSLVGHSSSAGAMLSLIRAALALGSKVLPPSGGSGDLAPDLPFGPSIELSRVARSWTTPGDRRRRAAVNSFGMTGIDHHVLLEEAERNPCRQDYPAATLEHPATRVPHWTSAERFVLAERVVTLPDRQPLWPVRGRTIAIVGDGGTLTRALERVLAERGAKSVQLQLPANPSEVDVHNALGMIPELLDGIIDVSSFANEQQRVCTANDLWPKLKDYSNRTFALLRVVYGRLSNSGSRAGCYVAVTSVGGTSMSAPAEKGLALGAFFQGLARALKQELPSILCKAVDIGVTVSPDEAAEAVVREIEDGNDRVDVRYDGRRIVTMLDRANFQDVAPVLRKLEPEHVFLFSGGGRGVVYECAVALARLGVTTVVTGRRPMPDPELPWVTLSETEFADFRRAELGRRRGADGPARVIQELDSYELQRQVFANVTKARAAGLPLFYEVCDITDPTSVQGVVERIRQRFGRLDGVGHGAMIEHSATILRKSSRTIDATLATKVLGLVNLVEATRGEPPKWFVGFGSGVGRYGNSGQTDYAAANAVMARVLDAYSRTELAGTHCVTIDWPAWESLGATSDPDIAALLRSAGVTSISPQEGTYWFLSELALGDAAETVICGEEMLQTWPCLSRDADGKGERAIESDDDGRPLLPSRWPMIDRIGAGDVDSVVVEREFSVSRDRYLLQHELNGLPVLPATFGCELLAEVAQLTSPGHHVHRIEDFAVDAPLGLPRGVPVNARVFARVIEREGSRRTVLAETRTRLPAKLAQHGNERSHHHARIILEPNPPSSLGVLEYPLRGEPFRANSYYELQKDEVRLGKLFFNAHWIQLFGDEAIGVVDPPETRSMFGHVSAPRLLAHPLVVDSALQVAGSWDGYRNGFLSVPIGISTIDFGRPLMRDERTKVLVRRLRVEHPDVYYDICILGQHAEIVLRLSGVHIKRVGNPKTSQ